jgi:hypothetical protein
MGKLSWGESLMTDPVTLTNLVLVGEFTSLQQWVNKAKSWTAGHNFLFVDRLGRLCRNGGDMMRARDSDAFPVQFYDKEAIDA